MTPLKTVACITLLATIVGLVTAIPAPQDITTGEQNRLTDESRKTNEETSTQFNLYLYLYKSAKLTMGLRGYDYYLDQPTRYHHMRLHANVPPSISSETRPPIHHPSLPCQAHGTCISVSKPPIFPRMSYCLPCLRGQLKLYQYLFPTIEHEEQR